MAKMDLDKYVLELSKEQYTDAELEGLELNPLKDAKVLKYSDEKINKLTELVFAEFEAIKSERDAAKDGKGLDNFFDERNNQHDGKMPRRAGAQFNVDCGVSKIKDNDIISQIFSAHTQIDPIVSVKSRPGFSLIGGNEVCEKQEDFIDYAMDERIRFKAAFEKAVKAAVTQGVGVIKWTHRIKKTRNIRQTTYKGNIQQIGVDELGKPILENTGLKNFLEVHGEAIQKDPARWKNIIARLQKGKNVTIDEDIEEIEYNDPFPTFVNNKNFYVRLNVDGYDGLCDTQLIVERKEFNFYELKQFEREYDFINVDELLYDDNGEGNRVKVKKETDTFNVLECHFQFYESSLSDDDKEGEEDEEPKKIICFFEEEKKKFLGGIYYPFTTIKCPYVPHYVKLEADGFYQPSITEDLFDIHIAMNAFLNFALEGSWISTIVTPITKEGSAVDEQFRMKSWVLGLPLNANPGEVDFLSNHMTPPDISKLWIVFQELSRIADQLSKSSELRTGRESALDPNAPASKTAMLLDISREGIAAYSRKISEGFALDANIVLKMYAEISEGDQLYLSKRTNSVVGQNPFKISRSEMLAKTSIQSQSYAYDFDKLNAYKKTLAFFQLVRPEPVIANNPESVLFLLKFLAKDTSQQIRNAIDQLFPSVEEMKKKMSEAALTAVAQYVKFKTEEANRIGKQPELKAEELLPLIQQLTSEIATNPPKEVLEERAKAQGAGV